MTTLYQEILDKCTTEELSAKNFHTIAQKVSAGRIKVNYKEIGKGTVLSTIGLTTGNALLDVIDTVSDFRHVKNLLATATLDIGSPLVRAALDGMVGTVLTQDQANALKAVAETPDPVTWEQCREAIEKGV